MAAVIADLVKLADKAGFTLKAVETARDPYYVLLRQSDGSVAAQVGLENIHTAIRNAPREWEPSGYESI